MSRCTKLMTFAFTLAAGLGLASSVRAEVNLPGNKKLDQVDFERHIMGLFGRMGCNSGSCHGSFQGKGGFRLSLFGFEPEKDFGAATRDSMGRRVNSMQPDDSLLLLKATGQVEHGGGMRFSKDSWQYRVFRDWIQQGSPWKSGSGEVKAVTITPPELPFKKPGETRQLQVKATFADGSENDITVFCDFRTNDDAVAEISNLGEVKSIKPGSTALIVTYRGNVLPVRVFVPAELPSGFQYPKIATNSYVDEEVFARLRQLNMVPSELSSDEDFLRRVTIDTIGALPTPDEVRAFLNDKRPDKRARKIDELLEHPLHAALWATKFCDITGNDTLALEIPNPVKPKRSQMWHDWFRKRVAENMPYDQIVKGVLLATTRDGRTPEEWMKQQVKQDADMEAGFVNEYANRPSLDLFWRRQQQVPIEQWGEKTAAAFMGIRLECAQCHKHPFDRWSQVEYRAYANIFGQVSFSVSPEAKTLVAAEMAKRKGPKNNQIIQVREVWVANNTKSLPHPDTNRPLVPKTLGGPEVTYQKDKDMREQLYNWLVQPDNPFFARSFVNRIWGHYLGIGIVHPVDDFSLANPASNDRLLDALAKDFIDSKFDIRHMERRILNSRVYQLSSKTNDTNKHDKNNFARSYVRPMMAEAVLDVINSALGVTENWSPDIKPGSKAVEVGSSTIQNQALAYTFRIFGRPPRTAACDCERGMEPALPQKLFTMTDPGLLQKLNDPKGRLQTLLKSKMSDDEILEELFLATLSHMPTEEQRRAFAEHRERVSDRRAAFMDVMWALLNTREFILNH